MPKACQQCRSSKRRCVEVAGGYYTRCRTCQRRNIACSKSLQKRQVPNIAPFDDVDTPSNHNPDRLDDSSESLELSSEEMTEFVDNYLHFIHDRPHSLFHEKTLWNEINTGSISGCLLNALCAMGCRFSTNMRYRNLGQPLRTKSSALFAQRLETVSIENIQTCILLANLYAAEQSNHLEALYFGIANRMAHILRLHENHPEDHPVLREIKCRIWWTLFVADRWSPPGLGLPRDIKVSEHLLDLPTDELTFQRMDSHRKVALKPNREGVWRYMVTLTDIVGPIQDLNHLLVQGTCRKQEVGRQVAELAGRLQAWHDTLPDYMKMNEANLDLYRSEGQGGTLVALHIGYHHYSTLLYFQYLDSASHPTAETSLHIKKCRHHALSLSNLIRCAREKDDCHVVYLTVAYVTMVSSSVLLHMLLFGEDEEIEVSRYHLNCNFEALLELKNYWPNMDNITQRLLTFQKACLHSTNTKTYKMDKWMLRFLLEYGLPFEDKDSNRLHDPPINPSLSLMLNHEVPRERTNILDEAFAGLCG